MPACRVGSPPTYEDANSYAPSAHRYVRPDSKKKRYYNKSLQDKLPYARPPGIRRRPHSSFIVRARVRTSARQLRTDTSDNLAIFP